MSLMKWDCFVCGDKVIEGQKFTFVSKGPVHLHCLEKTLTEKYKGDSKLLVIQQLIRALDASSSGIVAYKQLKLVAANDELKKFFEKLQVEEEKLSTLITKEIEKYL